MARSAVVPHNSAFTAMHLGLLEVIDLDNAADGYFFATQLPFRLNIAPANIQPAGTVLGLTLFSRRVQRIHHRPEFASAARYKRLPRVLARRRARKEEGP